MRHSGILSKFLLILVMFSLVLHPQVEVFAITAHPQEETASEEITELLAQNDLLFSYDDIVGLLAAIENEELESRGNPDELERLTNLLVFLAREGALPDELDEELDLEDDIQELLSSGSTPYEYSFDFYRKGECFLTPAVYHNSADLVLCKNWLKKTAKQIEKFVKKHKKEIIIGAVVVIAAVAIVGIAVVATTAAGAAAAEAGAAGSDNKEEKNSIDSKPSHEPSSSDVSEAVEPSLTQPNFREEVLSFKESIVEEQFFQSNNSGLSMEENGRILGQVFAHQSLDSVTQYGYSDPITYGVSDSLNAVEKRHDLIDSAFSFDSITHSSSERRNFRESVYSQRGQRSFELHHYDQAIFNFGKVIELNPSNHIAYLDRAAAYLKVGEYENSLADYQQYTEQKPIRQQGTVSFYIAFAKALPRGVRDSGCQLGSFVSDAARHPINTATEVIQAFATLSKLVYSQEWATIGETLTPEVYELVTKWDIFSSKEQGDLAGYSFGKYGSDILIPGASVKLLSKGIKGAKELAIACNALKIAEKTLALEALAGNSQVFTESLTQLRAAERSALASKELSAVGNVERFLSESGRLESINIFKKAETALALHGGQYFSETQARELIHQAGIRTFPRPVGIPENFRIKLSDGGAGMKYIHPEHTHTSIRIMPGKPHSPNPRQQRPYVIYIQDGKVLDKFGNQVSSKLAEAHIPLEEFVYRGN